MTKEGARPPRALFMWDLALAGDGRRDKVQGIPRVHGPHEGGGRDSLDARKGLGPCPRTRGGSSGPGLCSPIPREEPLLPEGELHFESDANSLVEDGDDDDDVDDVSTLLLAEHMLVSGPVPGTSNWLQP